MNDLSEGARVDSVYFESGSKIIVGPTDGVNEMVVSMEAGQHGTVPWIKIYMKGGKVRLINCEKLAAIDLATQTKPTLED